MQHLPSHCQVILYLQILRQFIHLNSRDYWTRNFLSWGKLCSFSQQNLLHLSWGCRAGLVSLTHTLYHGGTPFSYRINAMEEEGRAWVQHNGPFVGTIHFTTSLPSRLKAAGSGPAFVVHVSSVWELRTLVLCIQSQVHHKGFVSIFQDQQTQSRCKIKAYSTTIWIQRSSYMLQLFHWPLHIKVYSYIE